MKKTLSLFLLCAMAHGLWAQTETIDFTTMGYSNAQVVETVNAEGCSIVFDVGGNSYHVVPRYYTNGDAVRVYGQNTMTVTTTGSNIIVGIDITYASGGGINAVTASTGTLVDSSWSGSATSVTFSVGGSSGHRRVRKVVVTYQNTITPPTITGTTPFTTSTEVTITAPAGTIYYTTDGNTPSESSSVYGSPITINSTTTIKAIARVDGVNSAVSTMAFVSATDTWSGSGTAANPFLISNTADLNQLAVSVNGGETYNGIYFRMTADITYDGTTNNYTPVGGIIDGTTYCYFYGIFDGDGHTISGININKTGTGYADMYKGIFGMIGYGGIVQNLTLANSIMTAYHYVGGIAGYNVGRIVNCHVLSSVTIHTVADNCQGHGGITGYNNHYIFGCTSAASITMADGLTDVVYMGGVTGILYRGNGHTAYLYNSLYLGNNVQGNYYYGTITGYGNQYFRDCLYLPQTNDLEAQGQYTVAGADNYTANVQVAHTVTSGTTDMVLLLDGAEPNPDIVEAYGSDDNVVLSYGGAIYAAQGKVVTFSLAVPNGYSYTNVVASSGTLTNNGDGTFTLTMPADYVTITATLLNVVDISVSGGAWYAIAAPTHDVGDNHLSIENVTNLTTGADYDLFYYDEPQGKWMNQKEDINTAGFTSLDRGRGYIYRRSSDATLSFSGQPSSGAIDDDYSLTVSCADNNLKGFNLIGNPYIIPIYKGVAFGGSGLAEGWYSLNPNGTWHVRLDNESIAVGQAALVKVSGNSPIDLTFVETSNAPSDTKSSRSVTLAFSISNGAYEDIAYAVFGRGEGLPKIAHLNVEAPRLSIPWGNRDYAIAVMDGSTEEFPLVFSGAAGEYTLDFMGVTGYCHLIDDVEGNDIDLLKTPTYTFTATAANAADRFLVRLCPDSDGSPFAYQSGDHVVVNGQGTLQAYDIMGRLLFVKEINSQLSIFNSQFSGAGVYILRLNEKSQKIVIK